MRKINLNDEVIKRYAKKIMGFAYSKTRNIQLAEDLSQEILLSLAKALSAQDEIADMDGFVFKVSSYTWSGYFRKNKRHWDNLTTSDFFEIESLENIEENIENKILLEKLRVEIAYLSKIHREITILFYYENKKGEEIASLLKIPHSTVRWHLGEIKKKLKEGIEMKSENLSYAPKRIMAGHDGFTNPEYNQCGLGKDRIVDNICLACYEKPLTIEEIARKLTIATGYLETHIERLCYMDYLKVVDKKKYQTNFFIETVRQYVLQGKYQYHNIKDYAERIFMEFDKRYDKIKEIGFLGSDLDKDFVLWAIMPMVINTLYFSSEEAVLRKNNIKLMTPIRRDGSRHWVCATLCDDDYLKTQTEFTKEEVDFYRKSVGNGIKSREDDMGNMALQLESKATIDIGLFWRNLEAEYLLKKFHRIAEIIETNQVPGEFDKLLIASEVENGYVRMEGDKPKMLIPYFSKTQYEHLSLIFDEIISVLSKEFFVPYIEEYAKMYKDELPGFLSKEEINYRKYKIYPQYAVLYWLSDNGYLRYPSDEEAKRLCTVMWSTK